MPTLPSNPPPAPSPPKPKQPSDDALEIDDVEAAAVLSSRPPPRSNVVPPVVPAAPRVPALPAIGAKPAIVIPADALSSTPNLTEEPRTRPRAKALLDDEEAGAGLEEVEPDRASAPPSVDSGDEIDTSELFAIPAVPAAARPVSTPPKPAPAAKPPSKDAPKTGGMIPIVAP